MACIAGMMVLASKTAASSSRKGQQEGWASCRLDLREPVVGEIRSNRRLEIVFMMKLHWEHLAEILMSRLIS